MGDPFQSPQIGRASPFVTSFSTVDRSITLLRDLDRRAGRGIGLGAGAAATAAVEQVRVFVQNNSGTQRSAFNVLALSGILGSIADADDGAQAWARQPSFSGTTPAATTDAFVILDEAAPYVAGGVGPLTTAVLLGVVPVDVNVTDAAHGFATPTASDTTKLTSAAAGPARIVYTPGGTGVKRCVVELCGQAGGGGALTVQEVDLSPSYTSIGTLRVDQDDGLGLSQPGAGIARLDLLLPSAQRTLGVGYTFSAADGTWQNVADGSGDLALNLPTAGTYFLWVNAVAIWEVTTTGMQGTIAIRLYDTTHGAIVPCAMAVAADKYAGVKEESLACNAILTVAGATTIKLQFGTWGGCGPSSSGLLHTSALDGVTPGTALGYLRLGKL